MAKKLGFALGSGGSRGVAHIGFLKAMEENGIIPDYISGSSMGSVVGACFAKGMTAEQMMDVVLKLKFSDIFDLSINPIGNGALLRSKKMRKKLASFLEELTFDELKIPFVAVSTDLATGKLVVHSGSEKVVDGVVASSSVPGIFKPLEMDNKLLVDGGFICRMPIKEVRDMGAEVIIAVDVMGDVAENNKKYNMFGVVFRMIEIMTAKISKKSVKELKPDMYLLAELGDMSQYKFKDLAFAYDKGYELGIKNAEKIKKLIGE